MGAFASAKKNDVVTIDTNLTPNEGQEGAPLGEEGPRCRWTDTEMRALGLGICSCHRC